MSVPYTWICLRRYSCPAPEILHEGSGLGSVANRRLLVSVRRDSGGTLFPRSLSFPECLYKVRQDRATILLIAPWWPKRTWFLEMITLVGVPENPSLRSRDVINLSRYRGLCTRGRPPYTWLLEPLSERPEITGRLFWTGCGLRCLQSPGVYPGGLHSRLAGFFDWCEYHGVDPRSAPLTEVADFLIALFDKGRSVSTISGYRYSGLPYGFCRRFTFFYSPVSERFGACFLSETPARAEASPRVESSRSIRVL